MFQDVFYDAKEGISEYVEDGSRTFASIRSQPHMPLDELAAEDTRIRRLVRSQNTGGRVLREARHRRVMRSWSVLPLGREEGGGPGQNPALPHL